MNNCSVEIPLAAVHLHRVEVTGGRGPLQEEALVTVSIRRRGHLAAFPRVEADNAAPCRAVEIQSLRPVVPCVAKDFHRPPEQQQPLRRIGHPEELGKGIRALATQAVPKMPLGIPQQLVDNLPVVR